MDHFAWIGVHVVGDEKAAAKPVLATPKLSDICYIVFAIELAALVCSSTMSAYTKVFMLEYYKDVKAPQGNAYSKMTHIGVSTPMVAKSIRRSVDLIAQD